MFIDKYTQVGREVPASRPGKRAMRTTTRTTAPSTTPSRRSIRGRRRCWSRPREWLPPPPTGRRMWIWREGTREREGGRAGGREWGRAGGKVGGKRCTQKRRRYARGLRLEQTWECQVGAKREVEHKLKMTREVMEQEMEANAARRQGPCEDRSGKPQKKHTVSVHAPCHFVFFSFSRHAASRPITLPLSPALPASPAYLPAGPHPRVEGRESREFKYRKKRRGGLLLAPILGRLQPSVDTGAPHHRICLLRVG
jgi:hypothetical protein